MIYWLKQLSWTRYWMGHIVVAMLISSFFVLVGAGYPGTFVGSVFYLGRELRDVEKLHDWDWKGFDNKGFFLPLLSNILFFIVL